MRATLVAVLVSLAGLAGAASAEERLLDTIRAERVPADGRFEPFPRWVAPSRPTIALALSGGGARGIAHLGVLHALREDGIEIDAVAGTSAGALVGGLLAAGYRPDEIEELVATRRWNSILAGLDLRTRVLSEAEDRLRSSPLLTWRAGGEGPIRLGALADPRQLHTELYRYLLHAQRLSGGEFDRLRYRFRAVATDLLTGRQIAPARGDLAALLRGSMAFPGVFAPVPYGDAVLADGGLVENIPVETARTLGTDLVIAADVSEEVVPTERLTGTLGALNRTINILLRDPSERSRARADFVFRPAVGGVSSGDFETNVGPLVAAGREAYDRVRVALWDLLDSRARDRAMVRFDAIEGGPGSEDAAAVLLDRLGPGPRTVSRLRLETEIARLLDRGAYRDGRIEVLEGGGRRLLRVVVEPNPALLLIVREGGAAFGPKDPAPRPPIGEPFSWEAMRRESSRMRYDLVHRGRTLLRVASADWEPETGTLRATVVEPVFAGIEIETDGGKVLLGLERIFDGLVGKPFRFDAVASRLEEIEARGVIRGWRLETFAAGEDEVRLRAIVLEDRHVEIAGSVAYRDTLGWAGLLRATATNLTGRGDSIEVIGLAAKDVAGGEARYRSEYLGGFRNVGFEAAAAGAEIERPLVDLEQDPVWSAIEIHDSARVGAGFFRRLVAGAVVRAGIEWQREEFEAGSFGPAERRSRTVLYLSADFDRRDRLLFPSEGFAVRYEGAWPLAGDELRRDEIRLDQSVSFGGLRPVTLSFRAAAGRAENADRPAYWFDPGGFRELYGFIPYGAQAPRYRRGGVTLRFRWLDVGAARSYVEIGADAVRTGFGGDGLPRVGETRYGYGLSATALFRGLGPITAGFARNREGAEVAFLTVGYPLGDRLLNSGR